MHTHCFRWRSIQRALRRSAPCCECRFQRYLYCISDHITWIRINGFRPGQNNRISAYNCQINRRYQIELTRDGRMKERKKPGLKRARKAPQYTKR